MIIIDEIRFHFDSMGRIRMDWSDLYFHAVDPQTNAVVPVSDILKIIDAQYDFLKVGPALNKELYTFKHAFCVFL